MADRRERLREQCGILDSVLAAYAAREVPEPERPQAVPLLRHYAMTDRHACGCRVCAAWRDRQAEFAESLRFVPPGHKWSTCPCPPCRFAGRLQLNCTAASNVRDLLIEMSYHANFHSGHGDRVMQWFDSEIQGPAYTLDWCAYEISRRPVQAWLSQCDKALRPACSGDVFTPGGGEREAAPSLYQSALAAEATTAAYYG